MLKLSTYFKVIFENIFVYIEERTSGRSLISYKGVNDFNDLKYLRGIVSFGAKKCGNGFRALKVPRGPSAVALQEPNFCKWADVSPL